MRMALPIASSLSSMASIIGCGVLREWLSCVASMRPRSASKSRTSIIDAMGLYLLVTIASRAATAGCGGFAGSQQVHIHPATRPAEQPQQHHVKQHHRQQADQTVARMLAVVDRLIKDGR